MKLYFTKGACSLASRIIINDVKQPCEYESVDLKTKKTADGEDFLKINPKGAVPALELESGELLTENSVILQYLADHFSNGRLLPQAGQLERYQILEWLNFISSDLHKGLGLFFLGKMPEEFKDQTIIPMLQRKLSFVNTHLENREFIASDQFTLPDAYMYVMLSWLAHLPFDINQWPNLASYFMKLK